MSLWRGVVQAGVMAAMLCGGTVMSQVQWVRQLSAPVAPVALLNQNLVAAPDGAHYVAANASDGETTRLRLARISATGAEDWVRWALGPGVSGVTHLIVHADSSATVAWSRSFTLCVSNFTASGVERQRSCFDGTNEYVSLIEAADGDVILASGNQRKLRKISTQGVLRWTRVENNFDYYPYGAGIDSAGNYFELRGQQLTRWSAIDGSRLSDVTLSGYPGSSTTPVSRRAVARAGGHIVVARPNYGSSAPQVTLDRFGLDGSLVWTRNVTFPTFAAYDDVLRIAPGDSDSVYILYTREFDSGFVAKFAANGTLLWQVQLPGVRQFLDSSAGVLAISSTAAANQSSSTSTVRPVAAADGALGAILFSYSRADIFAPRDWFVTNVGVAGVFNGFSPLGSYVSYPPLLQSSTLFLGPSPGSPLLLTATAAPAAHAQSSCLMPRLAASSPASSPGAWWARTQTRAGDTGESDWTKIAGADGSELARAPQSAVGCGLPTTSDAGRVIVSSSSPRAKRVDSLGAVVWQLASALTPVYDYFRPPLQVMSADNSTTYAVGSIIGRVSATGSSLFETETNGTGSRYLAVDTAGNTWSVAASDYGDPLRVRKLSPAGAVLWTVTPNAPGCNDSLSSAVLTATDDLLIATQACGEARVYKIGGDGQVRWQRVVSGTQQRAYSLIKGLHTDQAGNVVAGGCIADSSGVDSARTAASLLTSWTANGTERWTNFSDLLGGAAECITSVVADAVGNVFAATSFPGDATDNPTAALPGPLLWSLTTDGAERWQHRGVLSGPFANSAELRIDDDGKLIVLGGAPPDDQGARNASLRRIDVSALGTALNLQFLQVPESLVSYRDAFSVRIGLRTPGGAPATATTPVEVRIGQLSGRGALAGPSGCIIAVGSDECTISGLRYDVIEMGVVLTAAADTFRTAFSPAIGFKVATTTTSLAAQSAPPYQGYSVVRIRATVDGPPPSTPYYDGYLYGPSLATPQPGLPCTQLNAGAALPIVECEVIIRAAAMPVTASFTGFSFYASSAAPPLTLAVTPSASSLQVVPDPTNSNIVGDRLRFRVAVIAASGINAAGLLPIGSVSASAGSCNSKELAGNLSNGFAGSYVLCEIAAPAAGMLSVTFSFPGNADLLAALPVNQSVSVVPGAIIRGNGNPPGSPSICSTTPGVTCAYEANGYDWRCIGPSGMSGEVFFIPNAPGGPYNYPGTPLRYQNLAGLLSTGYSGTFRHQVWACKPDVDGDGAVLAMTDGILILRRMLGLTDAALRTGAIHSCVTDAGKAYAATFPLAGYDIDGDGQTRAETDGLLMLRYLLGIRGNALVAGAIGAAATRTTTEQVTSFFTNECGLYAY